MRTDSCTHLLRKAPSEKRQQVRMIREIFLQKLSFEQNFKGRVEIRQTDKVERVSQTEISAYAKAQGHKSGLYCMK